MGRSYGTFEINKTVHSVHRLRLATLYLTGAALLVSGVQLYWDTYNAGYYQGFVEGEDHSDMLHDVEYRERVAWNRRNLDAELEALLENTRGCLEACEDRGYPSLNAFWVQGRDRCMCQHPYPTDDIHGFFFLIDWRSR